MEHLPTLLVVSGWVVSLVLSLIIGSFLPAYFKKKGENLATKEDFNELKAQNALLAQTTKEIESKIDDQVWNRQRHWELKRDALLECARATNDFMAAVMTVNAAFSIEERKDDLAFGTQLANHHTEAMRTLNKASYDFQRASIVVSVVSGPETQTAFVAMEKILKTMASKIVDGNTAFCRETIPLTKVAATAITNAIRKELGIEVVGVEPAPQSSESSAT